MKNQVIRCAHGSAHRCKCEEACELRRRQAKLYRCGRAAPRYVPAVGVRRRLQGLAAAGFTRPQIAAALGKTVWAVDNLISRCNEQTTMAMRDTVDEACRQLLDGPSPTGTSAVRARAIALSNGWWPLDFWDDIDTDPEPGPVEAGVDEIAVMHAIAGDMYWHQLGPAEKRLVVAELDRRGYGLQRMVVQLRAKEKRVWDVLDEVRNGPRDRRRRRVS